MFFAKEEAARVKPSPESAAILETDGAMLSTDRKPSTACCADAEFESLNDQVHAFTGNNNTQTAADLVREIKLRCPACALSTEFE